jgi:5-methylcytosine-specific restriction endonuclease McrA
MGQTPNLEAVSDDELRRRLSEFLRQTRRAEADLIAHMAEFDARRLYAREAAPSMFAWCTEVLHLSEHEAYLRITVARASREHPMLLAMLRDGRLHLSGICKLAPHLTRQNRERLLKRAKHRSKRQIEELVASIAPGPPAPPAMQKLPERRGRTSSPPMLERPPGLAGGSGRAVDPSGPVVADAQAPLGRALAGSSTLGPGPLGSGDAMAVACELGPDRVPASASSPQTQPAIIEPVAPARFRIRFDAGAELRAKLERLQALMRSSVPDGDLGKIIDLAVTEKLERLEAKRFAKTRAPRRHLAETDTTPKSRHIPAAVRRAVEKRDGSRCTFRDGRGRRCSKRGDLEFHHRKPFGLGGDHSPNNLCLMCRVHNDLLAEHDYGKEVMARHRRAGKRVAGLDAVSAMGSRVGPRPRCPS